MMVARNILPRDVRRKLASSALSAATSLRNKLSLTQVRPIPIYDTCERLGVTVRFNEINMEGMYQKGKNPRIHVTVERPLVRRAFTCAHELGHHVFGHGTAIDEMDYDANVLSNPDEFLANTFGSYLMMPPLGIRQAFAIRAVKPETASPLDIFRIASDFGVGYGTLITHLNFGLDLISGKTAARLGQSSPEKVRRDILGRSEPFPLVFLDDFRQCQTCDIEVGMMVHAPLGSQITNECLNLESNLTTGHVFRATKPGIVSIQIPEKNWSVFIRISRHKYVGLARYRHLEEDDE